MTETPFVLRMRREDGGGKFGDIREGATRGVEGARGKIGVTREVLIGGMVDKMGGGPTIAGKRLGWNRSFVVPPSEHAIRPIDRANRSNGAYRGSTSRIQFDYHLMALVKRSFPPIGRACLAEFPPTGMLPTLSNVRRVDFCAPDSVTSSVSSRLEMGNDQLNSKGNLEERERMQDSKIKENDETVPSYPVDSADIGARNGNHELGQSFAGKINPRRNKWVGTSGLRASTGP
ncbi:hypothetical protein NL676_030269 [Syzygium grande]|nr:hypothetical protein NL676_030269 [Syzygium grande]